MQRDNVVSGLVYLGLAPGGRSLGSCTWVLPPVLSCTAVLDSAVLAAKALKEAPKTLLAPNAISS
ncbi:hypothetical protein EYF80_063246 [Liparis tanakae]|uniref:Uncharacterized protein n=1 Tax=Liparis tanakae TaxID=230148 RepID=A0A4Z2ECQ7_9TELE|nr:hypothetical protein EYF80_063246 [Liparis tanakae]